MWFMTLLGPVRSIELTGARKTRCFPIQDVLRTPPQSASKTNTFNFHFCLTGSGPKEDHLPKTPGPCHHPEETEMEQREKQGWHWPTWRPCSLSLPYLSALLSAEYTPCMAGTTQKFSTGGWRLPSPSGPSPAYIPSNKGLHPMR